MERNGPCIVLLKRIILATRPWRKWNLIIPDFTKCNETKPVLRAFVKKCEEYYVSLYLTVIITEMQVITVRIINNL